MPNLPIRLDHKHVYTGKSIEYRGFGPTGGFRHPLGVLDMSSVDGGIILFQQCFVLFIVKVSHLFDEVIPKHLFFYIIVNGLTCFVISSLICSQSLYRNALLFSCLLFSSC